MPDEGAVHHVTARPFDPQTALPSGTHTFELSWSRRKECMRLRVVQCEHVACAANEDEWLFKTMAGDWQNLRGDKETGRFLFDARAVLEHKDGHPKLTLWEPEW